MPRNDDITTSFKVDISELKANIQEANRQIKLANSEFKAASSGMDNWSQSADGLSAKLKQLSTVEQAEIKKLDSLKQQYALVAEEQGENSKAAQDLMVKINNQQAAVNKTQQNIRKYTEALDELEASANETQTATQKLSDEISEQENELNQLRSKYKDVVLSQGENSTEAKNLASEMSRLNSELKENKSKMNDVDKAADELSDGLREIDDCADETGGGFTIMKGALANLTANAIQSAISAVGDFIGSLFELSEATEEYRSMMAKVEGSASSFGYSIDFAKSKYEDFYSYLGDDQMATNAITNLMGMKVSTETVSDAANAAIAVWSAYGDSIPIEGLTESINESAQVAKVTGSLADTINWATRSNEDWSAAMKGHSAAQKAFNKAVAEGETQEDAFSAALAACSSTQERADLIAQTLNNTYGKSKTRYDELSGSITDANKAELELKETQAELGKTMEPVNTAISDLKNKALQAILPVVKTVANAFLDFNNYLKENPAAAKAITAGVIALATAFGTLATALAIQALINGVQKAFALLNTTLLANPIVLVVAAITGLVAAFIYLWNTSESFRNFWIGLWNTITSTVGTVVNSIVNFFTVTIPTAFNNFITFVSGFVITVQTFFSNLWTGIINFFTSTIPAWIDNVIQFFQKIPYYIGYMIGYIIAQFAQWGVNLWNFATKDIPKFINQAVEWFKTLPGKIWTWLVNTFNKVVSWGSNMINKAKEIASNFVNNVINYIKQLPGKIWDWLSKAASKVVSWGADLASKGAAAAKQLFDSVVNGIKGLPGKMLSIGSDIVNGIWEGISGAGGWLMDQIGSFADGIVDGIKGFFGIKSPSRVMKEQIGKFLPMGLGEGVKKYANTAIKQVKELGKGIMKESEKINLDNMKASLSSSVNTIKSGIGSRTKALSEKVQQTKEIVFNQYNNSPKSLSRLDLYRQTNSLLFAAKGRLRNV